MVKPQTKRKRPLRTGGGRSGRSADGHCWMLTCCLTWLKKGAKLYTGVIAWLTRMIYGRAVLIFRARVIRLVLCACPASMPRRTKGERARGTFLPHAKALNGIHKIGISHPSPPPLPRPLPTAKSQHLITNIANTAISPSGDSRLERQISAVPYSRWSAINDLPNKQEKNKSTRKHTRCMCVRGN